MVTRNEIVLASSLLVVSLLVAVAGYALCPMVAPNLPVRIVFQSPVGVVLFDHKRHKDQNGINIACGICHHNEQNNGSRSCTGEDCHTENSSVTRSDALHGRCKGCHEERGVGPIDKAGEQECWACHRSR